MVGIFSVDWISCSLLLTDGGNRRVPNGSVLDSYCFNPVDPSLSLILDLSEVTLSTSRNWCVPSCPHVATVLWHVTWQRSLDGCGGHPEYSTASALSMFLPFSVHGIQCLGTDQAQWVGLGVIRRFGIGHRDALLSRAAVAGLIASWGMGRFCCIVGTREGCGAGGDAQPPALDSPIQWGVKCLLSSLAC